MIFVCCVMSSDESVVYVDITQSGRKTHGHTHSTVDFYRLKSVPPHVERAGVADGLSNVCNGS